MKKTLSLILAGVLTAAMALSASAAWADCDAEIKFGVKGIAEGCKQGGSALVGGETAEMPGFYSVDEFDIAGFAVGAVSKNKIINGSEIKPGDVLIGLPSSGVHSNGYSLVRKIINPSKERLGEYVQSLGCTMGEELLKPTRIYVKTILDLIEKGGANLTGQQKVYYEKTKQRDLAIVTLLLGTGIRVSECVGLDIEDVDFKNYGIKVVRKGGSEMIVYFGDEVYDALAAYIEKRQHIIPLTGHENALFLSTQRKRMGVQAVENIDDLNVHIIDKYARSGVEYQYSVSSFINGIENSCIIENVYSEFDGYYITDKDCLYGTIYNMDGADTTRNVTRQVVEMLNSKYMNVVSNSATNCDSGSITGAFFKIGVDGMIDHEASLRDRNAVKNRLANKKPLILKIGDGRIWMIKASGTVNDTMDGHRDLRNITFEWVEVGDVNDMKTLYMNGFSDVDQKWW